jgi:hypothetical protein
MSRQPKRRAPWLSQSDTDFQLKLSYYLRPNVDKFVFI